VISEEKQRELLAAFLDVMHIKFEEWHNKTYGTMGVRSLLRYPKETGLGYMDEAVQAQFFLFCELSKDPSPLTP
jgi:hypothetical protein